jgi:4-alpha-glucanotransferase
MTPLRFRRRGGVLCHITSLPGAGDTGTLGAGAREFVDFIGDAGLSIWQMLPLNPPDSYRSPYHSSSLFALDPNLLDPALGLSDPTVLEHFVSTRGDAFDRFATTQAFWLTDYCRFVAASALHGPDWLNWPVGLRMRESDALERFDRDNRRAIEQASMRQFAVDEGFANLRFEAAARGVALFGDMPLYPAFDSADVWARQDVFLLDTNQRPRYVAGVPPDYFSAEGQLWGNPVYDWERLAQVGFAWWVERLNAQLRLFDMVRIDHFRGLESYWAIPPDADHASAGHWRPGPGRALLEALRGRVEPLPVVAEDLGVITPAVDALRNAFELPGMRVLQFAFSGDPDNPHLPNNYVENTVVYTGTHDNDTAVGWYDGLDQHVRGGVDRLLHSDAPFPWSLIDLAFASVARDAIVPMQDFLALGRDARMNTPGVAAGNWRWRFDRSLLTPALAGRIRSALERAGRA